MSFQAVIFDMDGVIVDSEPRHERAFRQVFEEIGYGDNHGIDFPAYYGRSDRVLWTDFIERHRPRQTMEELVESKLGRFLEMIRNEEPIFPGMIELLESLRPRYRLGLASGSYHDVIGAILALRSLKQYFSAIVSSQDVARGKPAPDIFLKAADLLEVPAETCCVIEDSVAGVGAARAAGMSVIAITNSFPAEALREATHIVSSYDEIRQILA